MDRPVVPLDAVERRMKVERRHSDQRGRAHGFGRLRIRHRLSGRRRSAADPHVGLARHALDHDVDQLRALLVRYRRELAERPEDEQMVDTGLGNGARVPGRCGPGRETRPARTAWEWARRGPRAPLVADLLRHLNA